MLLLVDSGRFQGIAGWAWLARIQFLAVVWVVQNGTLEQGVFGEGLCT